MELTLVTQKKQINEIIEYIGRDYKKTPYLYVNTLKYGVGTNNVKCYIDYENDEIHGIYLKYFDCLHFFTCVPEKYPIKRFLDNQKRLSTKVIMTIEEFGERIEKYYSEGYYIERNNVIDMDGITYDGGELQSSMAARNDIPEIVDLLLLDEEYTEVYSRESLLAQMEERFSDGFSRFFIVRMDDKIVASCSTYGEVPGFALIGSVIVHPNYRRRGLARDVEKYACMILDRDGISRVGFVNYNNTKSIALHEKIGAIKISTLYKIVRKHD